MHTLIHGLIEAKTGEPVLITFTITDRNGTAVLVDGAAATYKIARRAGEVALVTKTEVDGITLSSNTAIVALNMGELTDGAEALLGDFFAQLRITMDGDGLVVAEGPIHVAAVIG
jgi:hypothetical protein